MRKGLTFILTGPSGVGKSSILKVFFERNPDVYFSISATTRSPRPGEADGVDYHFVTKDQFGEMVKKDALLEHAEFVGNCYGTPAKYVDEAMEQGRNVILDIEVQGAIQVKQKRPEVKRIFILPPNWEELEKRLTKRGTETPEKVHARLERAKAEIHFAKDYDYIIVNDDVKRAAYELESIITACQCETKEIMKYISNEV